MIVVFVQKKQNIVEISIQNATLLTSILYHVDCFILQVFYTTSGIMVAYVK